MNNTALRIENGMSSFELLQAKVSSLEATEKRMSIEEDRRMAAIDAMDRDCEAAGRTLHNCPHPRPGI